MMSSGTALYLSDTDGGPYAYMGVKVLSRYHEYWGDRVDVEFIPFFLGGIMVGAGNKPPASVAGSSLASRKRD
jgi:2-hydroxychromene-2-carboxylate isomerase